MSEITHDNDAIAPATGSAGGELGGLDFSGTASGGIDPEVSGALDDGNAASGDEAAGAEKDAKNLGDASENLDENEDASANKAGDVDTELSAGEGSGAASPALSSSPSSSAPMSSPQQPPMQPMSMPQQPQMPQMPKPSQGMFSMPASMLKDLAGNVKPDSELSGKSGSGSGADFGGKPVSADKIDVGNVTYDKTGLGPLTDSEMNATIEKALDLNGISKDPEVRAQWHEVLNFMAQGESSRNPDAVNLTDSNAIGAPAADGHPGQSSRGIWQTIPTTFAAHHVGGTSTNIYDPISSGSAAVAYIMDRYDVNPNGGSSLQKFYSNRMGGGYTGY